MRSLKSTDTLTTSSTWQARKVWTTWSRPYQASEDCFVFSDCAGFRSTAATAHSSFEMSCSHSSLGTELNRLCSEIAVSMSAKVKGPFKSGHYCYCLGFSNRFFQHHHFGTHEAEQCVRWKHSTLHRRIRLACLEGFELDLF